MFFSLSAQDTQIWRSMCDSIMDPCNSGGLTIVFSVNVKFGQLFQLYRLEKQFQFQTLLNILCL